MSAGVRFSRQLHSVDGSITTGRAGQSAAVSHGADGGQREVRCQPLADQSRLQGEGDAEKAIYSVKRKESARYIGLFQTQFGGWRLVLSWSDFPFVG